jgi:thiol-disulfide isomerase/thioredoxin
MKYFLITLFAIFISCQNENLNQISINVNPFESDTIYINGSNYEKKIIRNSEGLFQDTINVPFNGFYTLRFDLDYNKTSGIYLEKNKNIQLLVNLTDTDIEVNFQDDLKSENDILKSYPDILMKTYGRKDIYDTNDSIYSLDEISFLKVGALYKQEMNDLLNKSNIKNSKFIEMQQKNIEYMIQYFNYYYENKHKNFIKNPDFQTSENFPVVDINSVNMDDEDAFTMCPNYENLITAILTDVMYFPDREQSFYEFIRLLKSTKSKIIFSFYFRNLFVFMDINTQDLDEKFEIIKKLNPPKKLLVPIQQKYNLINPIQSHKQSPVFENYININGERTSLVDLKGKYIYIDVWATWCTPCLKEIPALKILQSKYEKSNIVFLSISLDKMKDIEKWKKMVVDKKMGGIHLIADDAFNSSFIKAYNIYSIPRFILLDPEGKIISADFYKPTNEIIHEIFNKLLE